MMAFFSRIRSRYAEFAGLLDGEPGQEPGLWPSFRPSFRTDWPQLALLAVLSFAAAAALRLLEAPAWNAPALMAGGERIMATHDSYCWLAGAQGVNEYARFGMSGLARLLSFITGAPLWAVGFWAPPFLAGLTGAACALWGWLLGGRRAAILPGLIGALAPGFYYRSRLGYFDSDPFTLGMPLLLGLLLAVLLSPCCSRAWVRSQAEEDAPPALPAWMPWLALGFGLVARVAHFAHDDIHPLGVGLFWLALGLGLLTALPGRRAKALSLLFVYALAAYAGPRRFGVEVFEPGAADLAGMALAAGAAWLCWKRPSGPSPLLAWLAALMDRPWPWLAGIGLTAAACGLLLPLGAFWAKALSYFKPLADAGALSGGGGPIYPGITQSIREAKNVADLGLFLEGVSFSVVGGAAGLVGIIALALFRPAFALLLPITALAFASLKLGTRFVMFGGPVFALGLGVGLYWLCRWAARRLGRGGRWLAWIQAGVAVLILAFSYAPRYAATRPTPVLGPGHAQALMELKAKAPADAVVWTWWDFGYATQYYAGRPTPTDGGRHAGRDIYPTALALTTDSPAQAARLIALAAGQGGDPSRRWDTMPALEVKREIEALREAPPPITGKTAGRTAGPQLLVVCWENLPLLYWISFYGSWDVAAGMGRHFGVMQVSEVMDLDRERGELSLRGRSKPLPLAGAEVLGPGGTRRIPMKETPGAPHLVVNELARQALLLDDAAYASMAVQLLVGDPARPELAKYFKLMHEGFPLVRIYEVLPGRETPAKQAEAAKQ
ncbi:MAG: hypothetical protein HY916_04220 [Desulfovibrio sp.]|jgi:dolichyl-diphosphooligosaccharide--protein glycosyltransferase|nr:hypothetical protein [Desulfovibrio sp.]